MAVHQTKASSIHPSVVEQVIQLLATLPDRSNSTAHSTTVLESFPGGAHSTSSK
jgi:tetrahydromethanopterin S-methyltransferase subunit B